jgi:excisionase family DNA binding protein
MRQPRNRSPRAADPRSSEADAEPELLDIGQAAALLQVSEASLRRWTNAGRLRSFRIGGRRERRFRRDDLLSFLESRPAAEQAGAPPDVAPRHGSPGHVCGVYSSDRVRTRQAARFLTDGLRASSSCFLVATSDVTARILAQLRRDVPTLHADLKSGRLELLQYERTVSAQLAMLGERIEAAERRGTRSVRLVGDVTSGRLARLNPFDDVLAYEAEFDRFCRRNPQVAVLCLYDARSLSGVELAHTFQLHGDAFTVPVEQLFG